MHASKFSLVIAVLSCIAMIGAIPVGDRAAAEAIVRRQDSDLGGLPFVPGDTRVTKIPLPHQPALGGRAPPSLPPAPSPGDAYGLPTSSGLLPGLGAPASRPPPPSVRRQDDDNVGEEIGAVPRSDY